VQLIDEKTCQKVQVIRKFEQISTKQIILRRFSEITNVIKVAVNGYFCPFTAVLFCKRVGDKMTPTKNQENCLIFQKSYKMDDFLEKGYKMARPHKRSRH
jgi:hypothetical protein